MKAVNGIHGWGKMLRAWMVLMGWESDTKVDRGASSAIELSDAGEGKAVLSHPTGHLNKF